MSDTATTSSHQLAPPAQSLTLPLFVWLVIQLIALALAAGRVSLSAHFAQPAETLALQEMVIVQFAASVMLMPLLLRDARAWLTLSLIAAPMLLIAGSLATASTGRIAMTWAWLVTWLATLALWRRALPARRQLTAVAIANLLTLGGLLLAYLESDFGSDSALRLSRFSPLCGVLQFVREGEFSLPPLLTTAVLLACGAFCQLLIRRRSYP